MNEKLAQLLQEIIKYDDGSPQQERILNQLLRIIPQLSGIIKNTGNPKIDYDIVFNDALSNVSGVYKTKSERDLKNLRKFIQGNDKLLKELDPDLSADERQNCLQIIRKKFVNWFNKILRDRIYDEARKLKNPAGIIIINIDVQRYEDGNLTVGETIADTTSINDIDSMINDEEIAENQNRYQQVKNLINSDEFNCYPDNLPQFTCKELIIRMEVNKEKLAKIIKELADDINNLPSYQTIHSHYKRTCKKLLQNLNQLLAPLKSN